MLRKEKSNMEDDINSLNSKLKNIQFNAHSMKRGTGGDPKKPTQNPQEVAELMK